MKKLLLVCFLAPVYLLYGQQNSEDKIPNELTSEQVFNLTTWKTTAEIGKEFQSECKAPTNFSRFFSWILVWEQEVTHTYGFANGKFYEVKPSVTSKPYVNFGHSALAVMFNLVLGFFLYLSASHLIYGRWQAKIIPMLFLSIVIILLTIIYPIFDRLSFIGFTMCHTAVIGITFGFCLAKFSGKIAWKESFKIFDFG